MQQKRPINLDLGTMKFPPMAIASILHRVSGVVLFLLMPVILYFAGLSLHSQASFVALKQILTQPLHKLILWAFGSALIYHLLAGIRHLLMDLGYGESLRAGRRSAIFVIALTIILAFILGIRIW